MKLCKLKLKNLNSLREIEIDFEDVPLVDASLVAITGPTGAGKTTILDAICVALYGKTPRLTGSGSQNPHHLISHGEKEGFAEVHFNASGTRYIAVWSGKVNRSPKGSLINADSNELITEKLSNKGKAMGDSENTVSEEITSILGLDFDAFKRSIMLAQGEFAAFLKASSEERRAILEATAGINIYDKLREALNEKVNQVTDIYKELLNRLQLIPDATSEKLTKANDELEKLQVEAKKLGVKNQELLDSKESETDRTEDYQKLQTSEEKQKELNTQQTMIDNLIKELRRAEKANQLRPEKLAYDSVKSEYDTKSEELQQIKSKLEDAIRNVETNQTDFNNKDEIYNSALTERDVKSDIYNIAILEINQAENQFEQANHRKAEMKEIDNNIETSIKILTEKMSQREELQLQINEANSFLIENQLPSDRHHRLRRISTLLTELNAQHYNLKEKIETQTEHSTTIDVLNDKITHLSEKKEKLLIEKNIAEDTLSKAKKELTILQNTGTTEHWKQQREIARNALPIAQQYETTSEQINDKKNDISSFQEQISTNKVSLDELQIELEVQTQQCKHADAIVAALEAERELALLANPINKLRQQLKDGQPCKVCGATDHPNANEVELESVEQEDKINQTLQDALTVAREAQDKKINLEQKQERLQQDISNCTVQIEEHFEEIDILNTEIENLYELWKKLYETKKISSNWVEKRRKEADTCIDNLNDAFHTSTDASNDVQILSQKLDSCEHDYNREKVILENTKKKLHTISDEIEDLNSDISEIEKRFMETIPDTFNGLSPDEAEKQFGEMIDKVETYEDNLIGHNTKHKILSSQIQNNQRDIDGLKERCFGMQKEIEKYLNQGEEILNSVRDKTDGLENKEEIDTAIEKITNELQEKNEAREQAETLLQESHKILTQKQTSYNISVEQLKTTHENLKNRSDLYYDRLREFGFNIPEEHDNAFRDEEKVHNIENQINHFNTEYQHLEIEIVALRNQFQDNPYDPELLSKITTLGKEIANEIQELQHKIGAQQQTIDEMKENLRKREELNSELQSAEQEMDRWKNIHEIIPQNKLRDFALDIMFQQVSTIANEHLKYLTSERYQLKVETIGKLSVMDRWNANEERPVETLSGGESFLTSMALALALSELSQGRTQLNSLFLDEGFGTLDAETLDIAIAALEGLQMQGRSIFIISHIQELTKRLPVKINVRKRGNGSSTIDYKY